ncbi:MAG: lysophospholipid acyltransferase family protein [Brachymonas sp.]|nr:lysophospholipid acyltransferase family protein [Brachymonas sp.]
MKPGEPASAHLQTHTVGTPQRHVLRGAWRAFSLVLHIFRGLWIVWTRFGGMTPAQQQVEVVRWAAGVVRHCGITLKVQGQPAPSAHGTGALLVANHISFLDIPAIHATGYCRFVSKDEVKSWPLIGTLATRTGTLYLHRASRRDALRMLQVLADALRAGDILAIFPEGTTSDGLSLLPFHANLLQAPIDADAPVQPVAIRFFDAQGNISLSPCYIGDDTLVASLWRTLCDKGLEVRVRFGTPENANGRGRQQWAQDLRLRVQELLQQPHDVD